MTDRACAWLQELADSVTGKLEEQIRETDTQLSSIVSELEQGQEALKARRDALQKTQGDILKLNSRLDGLIMQLVD
jgi:chromosome segregation ATPase